MSAYTHKPSICEQKDIKRIFKRSHSKNYNDEILKHLMGISLLLSTRLASATCLAILLCAAVLRSCCILKHGGNSLLFIILFLVGDIKMPVGLCVYCWDYAHCKKCSGCYGPWYCSKQCALTAASETAIPVNSASFIRTSVQPESMKP